MYATFNYKNNNFVIKLSIKKINFKFIINLTSAKIFHNLKVFNTVFNIFFHRLIFYSSSLFVFIISSIDLMNSSIE